MNESKFTELVNSYFDQEITVAELECLRQELAKSPKRKHEFEVRYSLHKATCSALSTGDTIVQQNGELVRRKTDRVKGVAIWLFGLGAAACFALSLVFSATIFHEPSVEIRLSDVSLNKSDVERYIESQSAREQSRGSLASQLRLMGLSPDVLPAELQLKAIDSESLRQLEIRRQRAIESIDQYRAHSAFSKLQYPDTALSNHQRLPAGFRSSLASY